MSELESWIIEDDQPIKSAIKKIDENSKKIVFVVDRSKHLIGSLSDGDIRRWILKNGSLQDNLKKAMNEAPVFVKEFDKSEVYQKMKQYSIQAIPQLDKEGKVKYIFFWDDIFPQNKLNKHGMIHLPVVIMAGGKGTRLYPYTKILPKPLIPIGEIPIAERIINRFYEVGCRKFYMIVNYRKNMIRSYFGELECDYTVDFIEEQSPLGTGGGLFLLKDILEETFFLSNCDILIDADYPAMVKHHKENGNKITMVTSLKKYTIPYGVVHLAKDGNLDHMEEKPENHYLVNTGMYILEPEMIDKIPKNQFYHMTQLIEDSVKAGLKVGVYPISERSWLDMGEFKELDAMMEKLGIQL